VEAAHLAGAAEKLRMKRVEQNKVGLDFADANIDRFERRVGAEPQRTNHRHRPSLERVVVLVAVKLQQVEFERLQALLYIGALGVDEDADQPRASFDDTRNRRGRVERQASRTRRIKIEPDKIGAEADGHL